MCFKVERYLSRCVRCRVAVVQGVGVELRGDSATEQRHVSQGLRRVAASELQVNAALRQEQRHRSAGECVRRTGVPRKERKGKEEYLYSAFSHQLVSWSLTSLFSTNMAISETTFSHQGTYKALRHGSHSFSCKQHHACLSFVAFTRCHHRSN